VSNPSLIACAPYYLNVSPDVHSFDGYFEAAGTGTHYPLAGTTTQYQQNVIDVVKAEYASLLTLPQTKKASSVIYTKWTPQK